VDVADSGLATFYFRPLFMPAWHGAELHHNI